MPELLCLETPDWRLYVWSKDISASQQMLSHTLSFRQKKLPSTLFRFKPILHLTDLDVRVTEYQASDTPLFFENKLYEFDFQFIRPAENKRVRHRLKSVEDAFHVTGQSIRGSINFGNDKVGLSSNCNMFWMVFLNLKCFPLKFFLPKWIWNQT